MVRAREEICTGLWRGFLRDLDCCVAVVGVGCAGSGVGPKLSL